jgi:hypothetical protein
MKPNSCEAWLHNQTTNVESAARLEIVRALTTGFAVWFERPTLMKVPTCAPELRYSVSYFVLVAPDLNAA